MKKCIKSTFALVLSLLIILSSISLQAFAESKFTATDGDTVVIQTPNYTVKVAKKGFRYGFYRPDNGTAYADMHSSSGICFGKAGGTVYEVSSSIFMGLDGDTANFEVTNTNNDKANVSIKLFDHYVKFSIIPKTGSEAKSLVSNLPEIQAASYKDSATQTAMLTSSESSCYLHVLGTNDKVNATVERLVTPNLPSDYTIESDVKLDSGSTTSVGVFSHYNANNAFHLFFIKPGAIGLKRLGSPTVDLSSSITSEGKAITIAVNTWYHLKMVVEGKTIKCYINDTLVFNATDSSATSAQLQGGCGLRADKANASFDNIIVSSNDGATNYANLDFENTDGITGWQHTKWETMLGSSGAEHIAADGTITPIPAYDPNINTYLYIKPSSLTAVSVKKLTSIDIPDDNYTFESRVRFENKTDTKSSSGIFSHFQAKNAYHLFYLKNGDTALKRLDAAGTSASLGDKTISGIKPNNWYRMKMVVSGKSVKGYLNDQLMFDANDATAPAASLLGGCGFRIYDDYACIDDIKVYDNIDPSKIYYQNDFDSKTLAEISGDFVEESDLLNSKDNTSMELKTENRSENPDGQLTDKYLLLNASPASSAIVTQGTQWADYTVSADTSFKMNDEQTSDSLVMRYTDSNNYYRFGFLKLGYVSLIKKQNGTETVLQEVSFNYSYDKFYNLKADLTGNSINCFVDGVPVIQATDSSLPKGTAGVLASTTVAKVNNFSVTGSASFSDTFDGDLTKWTITGSGIISYDGDPAQNPVTPPASSNKYTIDARVEGNINPMYGLGDYGAVTDTGANVRPSTNVFGVNRTTAGSFTNQDGGPIRFISNFSVAPQRGFAQVLFEEADKRVVINATETKLGVLETDKVTTLYYFFGDMKQIYQDYRNVRNQEGYEDTKPHYEMFGLGWEAFGALGWNAYQSNVMSTVQDYLNEGYNITWAVIGSGFWKGDRSGMEGTTTSFGMWDDTADPAGRNDTAQGMPNPRFPDPAGIKSFFKDKNIKLMLGLRVHLKLPQSLGGDWHPEVDGNFVNEGLANGYFLKNEDGSLMTIHAKYPCGNRTRGLTAYIDGENPNALEWYRKNANLWGVDGFKEDTMVLNNDRTYHDGNWNRVLSYMINKDNDVMIMRNGAYSLSGDILRINDANYGTSNNSFNSSPDRMPINTFAYAASGISNVYPDIIGGTGGTISNPSYQKYLVRNAQFAALNPSASVGINALKMDNQAYKQATFNAINWHSTYAPYIYDAALKSWQTGYPYSLTPLYIAYPNDSYVGKMANTTDRQYEWLLGESLLAAPQFGTDFLTADSRDVYLPEGKWIDYSTGETFDGPKLLKNRAHPIDNIPAFVGGKGVLVGEDMQKKGNYFVEVFPIANNGSTYDYTYIDGKTTSKIVNNNTGWSAETLKVRDTTINKPVSFTCNTVNHSIKFAYQAGHNYELTGGSEPGSLASVTAQCSNTQLSVGQTDSIVLANALNNDGTPASLSNATIQYLSSDSNTVSVTGNGKISAIKEGSADVWASVTLNNKSGNPVTVETNKIHITVSQIPSNHSGGGGFLEPLPIDKTKFENAINSTIKSIPQAGQIGQYDGQYPPAAIAALQKAIVAAQQALNTATTQEEVEAALSQLQAAKAAFESSKISVNRTSLTQTVKAAQNMKGNYTVDSLKAFHDALNKALSIQSSRKATQKQIDDAKAALATALKQLVPLTPAATASSNSDKTQPPQNPTDNESKTILPVEEINRITNSRNSDIVSVSVADRFNIGKDLFASLHQTKKSVVLDGGWYKWQFNGSGITSTSLNGNYLDTRISQTSPNTDAIRKLTKYTKFTNLHFSYEGKLPGNATIQVKIPSYAGKNVFVYYYNPKLNRLETVKSDIAVDNSGWLKFDIVHCSDYIVSESKIYGATAESESSKPTSSTSGNPNSKPSFSSQSSTSSSSISTELQNSTNSAIFIGCILIVIAAAGVILWRRKKQP